MRRFDSQDHVLRHARAGPTDGDDWARWQTDRPGSFRPAKNGWAKTLEERGSRQRGDQQYWRRPSSS
jgi:hypothetical protein